MDDRATALVQQFYNDELRDHLAYTALAKSEGDLRLRDVLLRSAGMELRHSTFWRRHLESRQAPVPATPALRLRLFALRLLRRLVNPVLLIAMLEVGEAGAVKKYFRCLKTLDLSEGEQAALRQVIVEEIEHEVAFRRESQRLGLEHVRDFVLGMNDGLIEVLGVVAGLSAVYPKAPVLVAVSGLIVGVAGALSMAIGAFVAVRSQRQVADGTRERMEVLFEVAPERAVDEYRNRLIESGVPEETARDIATEVGVNREAIAKLLLAGSRENELRSALLTGAAYLVGAFFPLLPYFLTTNAWTALGVSAGLSALALATVAAAISAFSGISLRGKVFEMVTAATLAAALSYGFGRVLQIATGITA